jgi:hypothetical protein
MAIPDKATAAATVHKTLAEVVTVLLTGVTTKGIGSTIFTYHFKSKFL